MPDRITSDHIIIHPLSLSLVLYRDPSYKHHYSFRPIFCSTAILSSSPVGMVTALPRRRRDSISAFISCTASSKSRSGSAGRPNVGAPTVSWLTVRGA